MKKLFTATTIALTLAVTTPVMAENITDTRIAKNTEAINQHARIIDSHTDRFTGNTKMISANIDQIQQLSEINNNQKIVILHNLDRIDNLVSILKYQAKLNHILSDRIDKLEIQLTTKE